MAQKGHLGLNPHNEKGQDRNPGDGERIYRPPRPNCSGMAWGQGLWKRPQGANEQDMAYGAKTSRIVKVSHGGKGDPGWPIGHKNINMTSWP
ncbi:hypothetical protein O181_035144 [Austropuccinia psidii MF-1]|uniref:Uncharacterized protein n=1 Tax=Austropuccinia psidii MF-1 TaxID=1389203 RepID=A0A9Q3HA86_9BASI|nr:hypothetical protein [Austropuccinia psidii MF-1]